MRMVVRAVTCLSAFVVLVDLVEAHQDLRTMGTISSIGFQYRLESGIGATKRV